MPARPDKPYRLRVRVLDGKRRETNKLKGLLVPHVDVLPTASDIEFIICAVKDAHLEQVRTRLGGAGLEEVDGDTSVGTTYPISARQTGAGQSSKPRANDSPKPLTGKPYGFVPLPAELTTAAPVWLDGTGSPGRISGEIRCELETLTPLLVGWERQALNDCSNEYPVHLKPVPIGQQLYTFLDEASRQHYPDAKDVNEHRRSRKQRKVEEDRRIFQDKVRTHIVDVPGGGWSIDSKSIVCPLRATWKGRPVIIPGDSLKGLLRQEVGALVGAPMERVAEWSYSYRPNMKFPDSRSGRILEPRLARVRTCTTVECAGESWPIPETVEVLRMASRDDQSYFPRHEGGTREAIPPPPRAEPYKGGMGAGRRLPDAILSADARRRLVHTHIDIGQLGVERASERFPANVIHQYGQTLAHLLDQSSGHFSARHPNVGTDHRKQEEAANCIREAAHRAFQPGDIIWVEWDVRNMCIVSFGWHYYYRWSYSDTVRKRSGQHDRVGLLPLADECAYDEQGAPIGLSPVRRLFGYTRDGASIDIGRGAHEQLMGRISVNAAVELVKDDEPSHARFLQPTYLRELGMPRPSAVEYYVQQSDLATARPTDAATLITYGDAAHSKGYDKSGELAGRKFYLDYDNAIWEDKTPANRTNDRSTLALDASQPGRHFRFTVRFQDLDLAELATILVALCPNQFQDVIGGKHPHGYCSKLGYARPLGWGSVRVEAKQLLFLEFSDGLPHLRDELDVTVWVKKHYKFNVSQDAWLAIHRRNHPDGKDYHKEEDKDGNANIYTFHTRLRAEHSRARRYRKP